MDTHTDPTQPEFSGGYDLRPPDCPTAASAGEILAKSFPVEKVIGGGDGLPYRRRVVSLSTWLDLEAYRLAAEENGGGSEV